MIDFVSKFIDECLVLWLWQRNETIFVILLMTSVSRMNVVRRHEWLLLLSLPWPFTNSSSNSNLWLTCLDCLGAIFVMLIFSVASRVSFLKISLVWTVAGLRHYIPYSASADRECIRLRLILPWLQSSTRGAIWCWRGRDIIPWLCQS